MRPWLTAWWLGAACAPDLSPEGAPPTDLVPPDPVAQATDLPEADVPADPGDDPGPVDDTDLELQPPGTGAYLLLGDEVRCADPSQRARRAFQRVEDEVRPAEFPYIAGSGIAIADFDADGRMELVGVGNDTVYHALPRRSGLDGRVLHAIPTPDDPTHGLFGALVWDADDDGDLDLLITGLVAPSVLLLNDGAGAFVDGTATLGLVFPERHRSSSASAHDFDGDGDLDLVVGGFGRIVEGGLADDFPPGDRTLLFRNDGAGVYTEASDLLPPQAHDGFTFVAAWLDGDGDGTDDLYLVNDYGREVVPNQLLLNTPTGFVPDTRSLGLDLAISGMGISFGHLDADGDEDVLLSDWGGLLGLQHAGGLWFDVTSAKGLDTAPPRTVAWGNTLADFDNDGDDDVMSVFGHINTTFGRGNRLGQPDLLLEHLSDGTFLDRTEDLRLDDAASHRGLGVLDIDRDGWLDMFRLGHDGHARLDLANCGEAAWLRVDLRQPAPNAFAVGARVVVRDGPQAWTRRLRAGGTSLATGLQPEAHFGLGTRDTVDLEITWPDGATDVFPGVPTRRGVRVVRP